MTIKRLHIAVGSLTVLIFLGTGMYMKGRFPEVYAANEAIRYQFRANHIYVLMAGLINLTAGRLNVARYAGWRKSVTAVATALVLAAPVVLVAAFLTEPARGIAERPLTFYGVVMLVTGTLAAYMPALVMRRKEIVAVDEAEDA